jgi:hypothetical protein
VPLSNKNNDSCCWFNRLAVSRHNNVSCCQISSKKSGRSPTFLPVFTSSDCQMGGKIQNREESGLPPAEPQTTAFVSEMIYTVAPFLLIALAAPQMLPPIWQCPVAECEMTDMQSSRTIQMMTQ